MVKKLYTDNTICNLTHECIYLQFQNHRQRNMKRNFMIILTLLTSTETQLTQARFKLAPSGTRSVAMPVNSVLSHLIQ